MLSDVMFIKDGALVLHMPMEEVARTYAQVVVRPEQVKAARALGPVFSETRFGRTVMVFAGVPRETLARLGDVDTPTLSDLFVALMTRDEVAP